MQPRVQKEKWSLYWKESMSTKTDCLDAFQLDVEPSTTIAEVRRATPAAEEASVCTCLRATENTKKTPCHAGFSLLHKSNIDGTHHCSFEIQ